MFRVHEIIIDPKELEHVNPFHKIELMKGPVEYDARLNVFRCKKGWRLEEISNETLLLKTFHKYRFIEDMK